MLRPFALLFLCAILVSCTSVDGSKPHSLANGPTDRCHGKPWSWCAGYHGNR